MRRRFVFANVALVVLVVILLEVPLALTYARREREASTAAAQRDAIALGALSEEAVESPAAHDPSALVRQFGSRTSGDIQLVARGGQPIAVWTSPTTGADSANVTGSASARRAISDALAGRVRTIRNGDDVLAAAPVGAMDNPAGAVVVVRSDDATAARIRDLWAALLLIAIAAVGAAALIGDRLSRWVTNPLRRLASRATALGHGDLGVRADVATGPAEATDLARAFNDMAVRLETLIEGHRQFVAHASHQLRSPLTALRLRLESTDPTDRATVTADIDAALHETARLSRLVDGLLRLARAEGAPIDRRPVDVTTVIRDRCDAWAALAEERGLAMAVEPGPPTTVAVGEGQLEQILDNLIDNAIEASPAGSQITVSALRRDGRIEIHVRDAGRGMEREERERAFDTFWQGAPTRRTGSAGLGLAIVDRLAHANGGEARLDEAPGGGLDALVVLPVE